MKKHRSRDPVKQVPTIAQRDGFFLYHRGHFEAVRKLSHDPLTVCVLTDLISDAAHKPTELPLADGTTTVLNRGEAVTTYRNIAARYDVSVARVTGILLELENLGLIRRRERRHLRNGKFCPTIVEIVGYEKFSTGSYRMKFDDVVVSEPSLPEPQPEGDADCLADDLAVDFESAEEILDRFSPGATEETDPEGLAQVRAAIAAHPIPVVGRAVMNFRREHPTSDISAKHFFDESVMLAYIGRK